MIARVPSEPNSTLMKAKLTLGTGTPTTGHSKRVVEADLASTKDDT
ncbi:hypothetical protein ABT010_37575 [Streptomyces sp. NPDC002668]